MRCFVLSAALLLAAASPALAQVPQAVQAAPPPAVAGTPVQTLYATRSVNIRSGAGTAYNVIGHAEAGAALQVTGSVPGNPHWVQLATGGFVAASVLSPVPVVVHHHHHEEGYTAYVPPPGDYPVGSCQPYSKVVNIAGQPPQQITGEACKQPDGTWKIVNYSVPQPIQVAPPAVIAPAPAPVLVEPAPVVVAPPPVVYYGPGYGPGYHYWH